jgi:hypothetical protein
MTPLRPLPPSASTTLRLRGGSRDTKPPIGYALTEVPRKQRPHKRHALPHLPLYYYSLGLGGVSGPRAPPDPPRFLYVIRGRAIVKTPHQAAWRRRRWCQRFNSTTCRRLRGPRLLATRRRPRHPRRRSSWRAPRWVARIPGWINSNTPPPGNVFVTHLEPS